MSKVHLFSATDLLRVVKAVEWPEDDVRQQDDFVRSYALLGSHLWDNSSWQSYLRLNPVIRQTLLAPLEQVIQVARQEAVYFQVLWLNLKDFLKIPEAPGGG